MRAIRAGSFGMAGQLICIFALFAAPIAAVSAQSREVDPLLTAFGDPPPEARPRVWWHWMNGNISDEGIRRDRRRAGV